MNTLPRTLFVYGTLRPGGRYWTNIAHLIEDYAPASLSGFDIYHLADGYPAIVDGNGEVFGDLLFIHSGREPAVWKIVDDIEQYRPGDASSLYLREPVKAKRLRAPTLAPVAAQAYVYNPERAAYLQEHGTLLPEGEWHPE